MCGIIGYLGPKSSTAVLVEGLRKLEYRGYDSAGIAVVSGGKINLCRVKGKIKDLEALLKKNPIDGDYGLGHTRWATHGRPNEINAHPHQDCQGKIIVVHNGIIENYIILKQKLLEKGHFFRTETDTEVIAHLIEENFSGCLEEAVKRVVQLLEGSFAFACLSTLDPEKIIGVRSGPPLIVGVNDKEFFLASDVVPILDHTRRVIFLDDGEIAVLASEGLKFFDFSGQTVNKTIMELNWSPLMVEKRGFKHFMLKEIYEQPQVIRETISGALSLDTGEVILPNLAASAERLKACRQAVIIACGTSYHAGLIGQILFESIAAFPAKVEYASEFRYRDCLISPEDLVIAISQSGETADTLAAVRGLKDKGGPIIAICNVLGSTLVREAEITLLTQAGPEVGVAATKTFSAQIAVLTLLALWLGQAKRSLPKEKALEIMLELQRIPHRMEEILNCQDSIETLAHRFASYAHFLYLGRWISFPVALEGALKLKEISYIHAEGYAGGEMKHGPIALIDEKMPTMVVIPKDRIFEKMLSNLHEIKARDGLIIALTDSPADLGQQVDYLLPIPSTHPLLTPFLTVLPLQLFAYFIANRLGADVDQPRNLAKSVTVE
ncbi:MAG: glutamine--fructose-6-phosphate transaminase (isomerizing) [Candidatus Aminicenantes bacterium]|nr:glutamine--fructose-6-phosphate transaminase (isomerizing) [Candidatus Aminicenantes bacterium]